MMNGTSKALYLVVTLGVLAACNPGPSSDPAGGDNERLDDGGRGETGAGHDGPTSSVSYGDEVRLSDAQMATLGIRVESAGKGCADEALSAPATVAFDPDLVAKVGPRIRAKVITVTKDLGDVVAAGDVVVILDSPELGRMKSGFLAAQAGLEAADAEYRRDQPLAKDRIISEAALQQTRAHYLEALSKRDAAREELRLLGLDEGEISHDDHDASPLTRYELKTPRAGVIQKRDLTPGETIEANETPILVVDTSVMWVMIDAYEQALPRLALGQPVTLRIGVLPKHEFQGEVDWISAALDEKARTVRVRAAIANPEGLLRAGMFGTAEIHTNELGELALVPIDSVQTLGDREVVFVPADEEDDEEEEGVFRVADVELGDEGRGLVEIRQGLEPGQPVVVEGAFDLMSMLTAQERSDADSD